MMAEMPAAAAPPVSVELSPPVTVEVWVAVEPEPEPEPDEVAEASEELPEPPVAEAPSRTVRALAPVALAELLPEEAEERASFRDVSYRDESERSGHILTLAVLGTEGNDSAGVVRATGLVGTVTHSVAEVRLPAVAEDVALSAAELRVRNAEHAVDACALWETCQCCFVVFTEAPLGEAYHMSRTTREMPMAGRVVRE